MLKVLMRGQVPIAVAKSSSAFDVYLRDTYDSDYRIEQVGNVYYITKKGNVSVDAMYVIFDNVENFI